MQFEYPDTTGWIDWQREYQFGALYIFPPPGVIETIDELRRTFDPQSADVCQAHISLSEPLRGPLTQSQLEELRAALSTVEPFTIHYGPLKVSARYPGITYAIKPEDQFMRLRERLHATSSFLPGSFARKDILPHMTIAEFITLERSHQLFHELSGNVPEGDFFCGAIEYAIPTNLFHFERVLTLPFGA